MQAELGGDLRRGALLLLPQPLDGLGVFGSRGLPVGFGIRKTRTLAVLGTPPGEDILPVPVT